MGGGGKISNMKVSFHFSWPNFPLNHGVTEPQVRTHHADPSIRRLSEEVERRALAEFSCAKTGGDLDDIFLQVV